MDLKSLIFGGGVKVDDNTGAYRDSFQEALPIKNIVGGAVVTRDKRFIKILEILPVNFYMKSEMEQKNIIYYFASYLKIAPDSLQMRVVTQPADVKSYINRMRECAETEENEFCREMIEENIAEFTRIASTEALTHRFFLVIQYEPRMKARGNTIRAITDRLNEEAETARRYLDLCGLEVLQPAYEDNAVLELLYELINKHTSQRVPLPEGVFDMLTQVHGIYV